MGKRLYIGNLDYNVTEAQITELFKQAGTVESATMITDKQTGRPKGFGFVEMSTDEEAQKAINQFNGQKLGEREIVVNEAKPMQKRDGGGDRGGFGGGRRDRY